MISLLLVVATCLTVHGQRYEIPPYVPVQYPIPIQYPREEWPKCSLDAGSQGLCSKIVDCPHAIKAITYGLHPPICYWERHLVFPLVCCPSVQDIDPFQNLQPNKQDDFSEASNNRNICGKIKTVSAGTDNDYYGQPPGRSVFDGQKKYPWMVSVYTDNEGKNFLYSGFLIDSMHVLTSAQGLSDYTESSPLTIRLGGPNDNGPLYEVGRCKVHGGYRTWVKYDDITILRLKDPIVDPHVPICLPSSEMKLDSLAGLNATVTGFNKVDRVPIVNHKWCEEVYAKFSPLAYPRGVSSQFICAGLQLKQTPIPHQTDVGAPMALQDESGRWTAVGMVSYDYKDAKQGFPGVYINLAHYGSWVEKQRTTPHFGG